MGGSGFLPIWGREAHLWDLRVLFIFMPYDVNENNLDSYTLPPLTCRTTLRHALFYCHFPNEETEAQGN